MANQKAKTFTGARAIVSVNNEVVGVFDSCTWTVNHGAEPIHTLGRFNPQEIALTSYEAVTVNCSGFRVIGQGVHKLGKVPKLQDLLNFTTIDLQIVDRQDASIPILIVQDCTPVNHSNQVNSRATSRIQITYMGLVASDEDEQGASQEDSGAVSLPE